jgi:hypothetical protein
MAYCVSTLSGIAGSCDLSKGGVDKVYLANYAENIFSVDPVTESVSGISTAVTFYEYNFKKGVAHYESEETIDATNGANFVTTNLYIQFNRMDAAKRKEMKALTTGDLVGIVKDGNGKYWVLGIESPLQASAGNAQTGTARTDGNFYGVTLTDEQESFVREATAEAIASMVIAS